MGVSVFIIAEAGVNHQGEIALAYELIDAAKGAGADAVKFQLYDCEKLDPPGERREMLRGLQLSRPAMLDLKRYADKRGIEFMCTPFDVDSLRFLVDKVKVKRLKIASGQSNNAPLLTAARESGLPVIVSAGMGGRVSDIFLRAPPMPDLTVLHCVSGYPVPDEELGLSNMKWAQGLSDHSEGIVAPIAAVALGAEVIEKHLTLDRAMAGPDHKASLEPQEFAQMVAAIRRVEKMGDGEKRIMPSEAKAIEIAKERDAWRTAS